MGSLSLNISFLTYGVATVAYAILLGLIIQKNQFRGEHKWMFTAVVISVIWSFFNCISAVAGAYTTNVVYLTVSYMLPFVDWLKGIVWIIFLYNHLRLIWNSQDNNKLSRAVGGTITVIVTLGFIIELVQFSSMWGLFERGVIGDLPVYNKFLIAFFILLLVENLYRNIARENRWGVRFFCLGLGCIYAFEFLLYSDSMLYSLIDPEFYEARGAVNIIVVPLLAIAVSRGAKWSVGISLTHRAAFHMISLIAGISYVIGISVLGYYIQSFGGEWGKILQVSFLFAAFIGFIIIIYSGKIRSTILVLLNKYFFMYKFDYREEWLRFIQTMTDSEDHYNLQERAIKSVANLLDCPGGALWYLDQPDSFQLAAKWNFRHDIEDELPAGSELSQYMEKKRWIVDLDDDQEGKIKNSNCPVPDWLNSIPDFWLVVPLIHHDDLKGFIVLYKPRAGRELNWETLDILKTVSLQIASYLVEQETLKALGIASEFEAFNRKFAFVIHDIKNMASQLSLLNKNAEKHGDNPEFQKDLKITVNNTVEKMNDLLSRINLIQEPAQSRSNEKVKVSDILKSRIDRFLKAGQNITVDVSENIEALSHEDNLDTVFVHIIQNALDASDRGQEVHVSLNEDQNYAIVKVSDTGSGMDRDFIRNELFRPFRSLKEGGYGIGAYESRQLIQNMGGRMEVKSKPGTGTIITIYLKKE